MLDTPFLEARWGTHTVAWRHQGHSRVVVGVRVGVVVKSNVAFHWARIRVVRGQPICSAGLSFLLLSAGSDAHVILRQVVGWTHSVVAGHGREFVAAVQRGIKDAIRNGRTISAPAVVPRTTVAATCSLGRLYPALVQGKHNGRSDHTRRAEAADDGSHGVSTR